MLVYHPIYDVNHCLYRMLLVLETSVHKKFEWDMLKLVNFYLLFPHLLNEIKPFPKTLARYSRVLNSIPDSYVEIPNAKRTLFDLNVLQNTAAMHMAAKNLIQLDFQTSNTVERTKVAVPGGILACIANDPIREKEWFKLVVDELPLLDLRGKSGLKKRSGLMEFQYDVVEETQ